jgi:hypothetical protein
MSHFWILITSDNLAMSFALAARIGVIAARNGVITARIARN